MTKVFQIGVLGMTHDHVWSNLRDVQEASNVKLTAAADPHPELREKMEHEFGCKTYEDYETMLDGEPLDAVFVFSDNAAAVELVEMAAGRGLHALVEKPMAASLEGADRMLNAARGANTRLMINWPFAWWPQMQHAIKLATNGGIGDVWQVRYRAAHEGPQELGCSKFFCDWLFDPARNGPGGAYMDYCCYGALLARVLLGMPTEVFAMAGRLVKPDSFPVEDNAALLMRFPRGLALSEGSWSQVGKLSAYLTLIYGTAGTLMLEPRVGGRLLFAGREDEDGSEVPVPAPPAHMRCATAHFLHGIETGEPFWALCHEDMGRDTQEILERGASMLRC